MDLRKLKKMLLTMSIAACMALPFAACKDDGSGDGSGSGGGSGNQGCDVCVDDDGNHACDVCGEPTSTCADANNDHKCDVCDETLTQCADEDDDHECDICGETISQCADADNDHNCDVCGEELSQCSDATDDDDHECDICGETLNPCVDANDDHVCDVCDDVISNCEDTNNDHLCDTCGDEISECEDSDDHLCDVCGDKISDCVDTNTDYECDICGAQLAAPIAKPVLSVSVRTVSWEALNGVTYKYTLNGGAEQVATTNSMTLAYGDTLVVWAVGDNETTLDSEKATYTAVATEKYPTIEQMEAGYTFDWDENYVGVSQGEHKAVANVTNEEAKAAMQDSGKFGEYAMYLGGTGNHNFMGILREKGNLVVGKTYTITVNYYCVTDQGNDYVILLGDGDQNLTVGADPFKAGLGSYTFEITPTSEKFALTFWTMSTTLDVYLGNIEVSVKDAVKERDDFYALTHDDMLADGGYTYDWSENNIVKFDANAKYLEIDKMEDTDLAAALKATDAFANGYALQFKCPTGSSYIEAMKNMLVAGNTYTISFDAYQVAPGSITILLMNAAGAQAGQANFSVTDNGNGTKKYTATFTAGGQSQVNLYTINACELYLANLTIVEEEPKAELVEQTTKGKLTGTQINKFGKGQQVDTPAGAVGQKGFGEVASKFTQATNTYSEMFQAGGLTPAGHTYKALQLTLYYYVEEGFTGTGLYMKLDNAFKPIPANVGYNEYTVSVTDPVDFVCVYVDGSTSGTVYFGSIDYEVTTIGPAPEAHDCVDNDNDHECDVCCDVLTTCADNNNDHACDVCGKVLSECEDTDDDHLCNVCGEKISECTDADDHYCDVCGDVLSECADLDEDGACDVCGAILAAPVVDPSIVNGFDSVEDIGYINYSCCVPVITTTENGVKVEFTGEDEAYTWLPLGVFLKKADGSLYTLEEAKNFEKLTIKVTVSGIEGGFDFGFAGGGLKWLVAGENVVTYTHEELQTALSVQADGSFALTMQAWKAGLTFEFTEISICINEDGDHNCDYCEDVLTACVDSDNDHECDVCGDVISECTDADDHYCDVCGDKISECKDNDDHLCDVCGDVLSECADTNNDYACDICGKQVGDIYGDNEFGCVEPNEGPCVDNDNDHECDYCGETLSECEDTDNDHLCNVCGDKISECTDADDHNCDICGGETSTCADNNGDHACDICGDELSQCADSNNDHKCDVCGDTLSDCADNNNDKGCDICGNLVAQTYERVFDFTTMTSMDEVSMFSAGIDPQADGGSYTDASWVTYARGMDELFTLENGLKVNTSVYSGNDASENNIYVRYNVKNLQYFQAELKYTYDSMDRNGWAGFILGVTNFERKVRWPDNPNGIELFVQREGKGTYSSNKINGGGWSEGIIPAGWEMLGEHTLTIVAIESGITLYADGVKVIAISAAEMADKDYQLALASFGFLFNNAQFTAKSFSFSPLSANGEFVAHSCVDSDFDHVCDEWYETVGTHEAAEGTHNCEYCGERVSDCVDVENDNECDICGKPMHECEDTDNDHNCNSCGKPLTVCGDNDNDHACDICGAETSTCNDGDNDHYCDICGDELSQCADLNNNHKCDVCGTEMSECKDENGDGNCEICGRIPPKSYDNEYDFTKMTSLDEATMFSVGYDPATENEEYPGAWDTYAKDIDDVFNLTEKGLEVDSSIYFSNAGSDNRLYVRLNTTTLKYFEAELVYVYEDEARYGWAGFMFGYTDFTRQARWGDSPSGAEFFMQNEGKGTYVGSKLGGGFVEGGTPEGWVVRNEAHRLTISVTADGIVFTADGVVVNTVSAAELADKGYETIDASIGFFLTNAKFTVKSFKVTNLYQHTVCEDNNNDHACDECGEVISECEDNDDHACDVCGEIISECADTNSDYRCDICDASLATALATPVVSVSGKVVSWEAVDGVTYKYSINDGEAQVATTNSVQVGYGDKVSVWAVGDNVATLDSEKASATVAVVSKYPTIDELAAGYTFDWDENYVGVSQGVHTAVANVTNEAAKAAMEGSDKFGEYAMYLGGSGQHNFMGILREKNNLVVGYTYKITVNYYCVTDNGADYVILLGDNNSNLTVVTNPFTAGLNSFTFEITPTSEKICLTFWTSSSNLTLDVYLGDIEVKATEAVKERDDFYALTHEDMIAEGGYTYDWSENNILEFSNYSSYVEIDKMEDTELAAKLTATGAFANGYALKIKGAGGNIIKGISNKLVGGNKYTISFDIYDVSGAGSLMILPFVGGEQNGAHQFKIDYSQYAGMYNFSVTFTAPEGITDINFYINNENAIEVYIANFTISCQEAGELVEHTFEGTRTWADLNLGGKGTQVATPEEVKGSEGFADDYTLEFTSAHATSEMFRVGNILPEDELFSELTITIHYYVVEGYTGRICLQIDNSFADMDATAGYHAFTYTLTSAADFLSIHVPGGSSGTIYMGSVDYVLTTMGPEA